MIFHCHLDWFESHFLADFERACAGFRVLISVMAQKDTKVRFMRILYN